MQVGGAARFCNKIDGAQGAGVTGIVRIALAGEYDDLDFRTQFQQIRNQGESFVRAMREGRQAEVDQRQIRSAAKLAEQLSAARAGVAGDDFKRGAHRIAQRVAYERIIIDDEQQRHFWQGSFRGVAHGKRVIGLEMNNSVILQLFG